MKIGFDAALYAQKQRLAIEERLAQFDGKLYLEFGGKLFDDFHASRVLPGFPPGAKIQLLQDFGDKMEVIFCISAGDIEKTKIRADLGISYAMDTLRLIDALTDLGILVNCVVITQYTGQLAADNFVKKLTSRGVKNYVHQPIAGYPTHIDHIVSEQGYGSNAYIETTKPLVVVTAPGPGSGKLATCLSQVYHEYQRGQRAGYAKFETFPVWNLPLKHPVNLAYEAATADLMDVNIIDSFHLEAYGVSTVNYNRDVDAFPIVQAILSRILGEQCYASPTDMGVNMVASAITDDEACCEASKQEIIRRYYKTACDLSQGRASEGAAEKLELIMTQLSLSPLDRPCVAPAHEKSKAKNAPAACIELPDGRFAVGRATDLMSASASCVMNAIKMLAGLDDDLLLISAVALEPMLHLKIDVLGSHSAVLKLDDVLSALAISASMSPVAKLALEKLPELRLCDMHSTQMLHSGDEGTIRKLGLNLTCDPIYPDKSLYF